jgi:hypothetical protein
MKYLEFTSTPFPFMVADSVLPENDICLLSNPELLGMRQPLRKATGNPADSELRHVLPIMREGVLNGSLLGNSIDRAVHHLVDRIVSESHERIFGFETFDMRRLTVTLCWDDPGYENPSHVDSSKKIATRVLYLFGNGIDKEGGTELQKTDGQDQLTCVRNIAPNVNRLLFFRSTPNSLHEVKLSETSRKVLIINYNRINNLGAKP